MNPREKLNQNNDVQPRITKTCATMQITTLMAGQGQHKI